VPDEESSCFSGAQAQYIPHLLAQEILLHFARHVLGGTGSALRDETPARQFDGDLPVQRRNARVKQLPLENPNR
jgi:hypothetical protein